MKKTKKIGIMGGTFNPIHFGHLLLGETAYEQFSLDEVLFMPTKNPYYKKLTNSVTEEDRMQMVQLAIRDNSHFTFSGEELDREGTTYTVETLTNLTERNPDCAYYFIMGADSLYHIESWKDTEKVLQMAVILVAGRGDLSSSLSSQIEYIENKYDASIHFLNSPSLEISSNDIRRRIRAGESIRYLLPREVEEYIYEHKLYIM
ncbi:MAG TPA: nicotinate-nucleotide adenylyltransferase [Candidatus Anaerobutyricum avicola]|mgnify:CR=1 FL=1|nr:nicotinate-nucleotide adenylyltransferase [Candidatus Anaerobutyricum avicola]